MTADTKVDLIMMLFSRRKLNKHQNNAKCHPHQVTMKVNGQTINNYTWTVSVAKTVPGKLKLTITLSRTVLRRNT